MTMIAAISEIIQIVRANGRNDEFVLRHMSLEWQASVVNPTRVVMIGEVSGEFESGWHPDADAAVQHLLRIVRKANAGWTASA